MHHIRNIHRQQFTLRYITLAYQILEPLAGSIHQLSTHFNTYSNRIQNEADCS